MGEGNYTGDKSNLCGVYFQPFCKAFGYEALARLAHKYNIPFIVDNTFATPYLFKPLDHGADIVVYSATKALNGHGNAIGGLVVEGSTFRWSKEKFPQFYKKHWVIRDLKDRKRSFLEAFPDFPLTALLRLSYLAYFGAVLSPYEAQLILIGVETLSERVKKQVENTRAVLSYLQEQSDVVAWVSYPETQDNPDYDLAKQYFPNGAGSVLSFGFKGTWEEEVHLIESVKIFGYQANVGDARSLIVNSPKITHGELTPEELNEADIAPETIRLSLGLEDAADLVEDLRQAFDSIREEREKAQKSA
jgi:O-acetylhomoserine (thiol)-lyase